MFWKTEKSLGSTPEKTAEVFSRRKYYHLTRKFQTRRKQIVGSIKITKNVTRNKKVSCIFSPSDIQERRVGIPNLLYLLLVAGAGFEPATFGL